MRFKWSIGFIFPGLPAAKIREHVQLPYNQRQLAILELMAKQQEIGDRGEKLAADYLEHKGFQLLAFNWRYKKAEVDIIARDGSIVVFIEVKTRTYNLFGPPDLAVNRKKESMLTGAAQAWIDQNQHEGEIRFDVISILLEKNKMPEINHIEDAFFWGLDT